MKMRGGDRVKVIYKNRVAYPTATNIHYFLESFDLEDDEILTLTIKKQKGGMKLSEFQILVDEYSGKRKVKKIRRANK